MERDEWESIALLIENCWKGEFDEITSASYFTLLGRFSPEQVMGALYGIVENGKPFVPSVPEIVAEVRKQEQPSLPSWTEVWSKIELAMRKCKTEDEAVAVLTESCHPVAGAFMRLEGFERLRREPFLDPDYGALRVRELQRRWADFSEVNQEKVRNGKAIEAYSRTTKGLQRASAASLIAEMSEYPADNETI